MSWRVYYDQKTGVPKAVSASPISDLEGYACAMIPEAAAFAGDPHALAKMMVVDGALVRVIGDDGFPIGTTALRMFADLVPFGRCGEDSEADGGASPAEGGSLVSAWFTASGMDRASSIGLKSVDLYVTRRGDPSVLYAAAKMGVGGSIDLVVSARPGDVGLYMRCVRVQGRPLFTKLRMHRHYEDLRP